MFSGFLAVWLCLLPFSLRGWLGLWLVCLRLYHVPGFTQHVLLVWVRERLQGFLVGHPFHRVVLCSYFRVGLVCLEEEEVDCLVERFCTESELVLDLAHLSTQLHPTHSGFFSNFSHCGGDLVFVFFDQPLGKAPDSALVAS